MGRVDECKDTLVLVIGELPHPPLDRFSFQPKRKELQGNNDVARDTIWELYSRKKKGRLPRNTPGRRGYLGKQEDAIYIDI